MMLDLPDPVSPTIKKCLFSASADTQGELGIVGRDADAITANGLVKSLAFTRTGPFRRRP